MGALLLQAFDHVEIREEADVAVNVAAAVGAEADIVEVANAGEIDGGHFLEELALSSLDIEAVDLDRKLLPPIDVQEVGVVGPGEDFIREETRNGFGLAAGDR